MSENRGVLASGHPGKEIERNVTESGSPCFPFPFAVQKLRLNKGSTTFPLTSLCLSFLLYKMGK